MSDTPQGPGWWQASDDKWYPPPRPQMPEDEPAAAAFAQPPQAPVPGAQPSPYPGTLPPGGPPVGPPAGQPASPTGQQPNRTPLMIALAVVAVLAVLAVAIALTGGGSDGNGEEQTDTTEGETTETTERPGPPDPAEQVAYHAGYVDEPQDLGEGVVLQEYGFSTVPDTIDPSQYLPTFGMVLENTSDEIRSEFDFEWIMYDESGSLLANGTLEAETLQPGETLGIGHLELAGVQQHVAEMEIRPAGSTTDWGAGSGSLSVSDVEVVTESNGWLSTSFRVESTYDYELTQPRTHLILRNSAGEIVAGDHTRGSPIPSGEATDTLETLADLSALEPVLEEAEIYVDAGYEHPGG